MGLIQDVTLDQSHLEMMDNYLQNLSRLNKSAHTVNNYRADLIKFFIWIQHVEQLKLSKINGEIIGKYKEFLANGGQIHHEIKGEGSWVASWFKGLFLRAKISKISKKQLLLQQSPMSVASRRRHLSSLKNFFQYLKEVNEDTSNKFKNNPVKNKLHAITLKDIDVVPTKMMTREEFRLIDEKTYRTKERLMLYLLYYGGLRLSELCYLKISNFDRGGRILTFDRKGGSIHTLAIQKDEQIFKNLEFYLAQNEFKSDFLFQNKSGKPYSLKTFYNQIMKIIHRADVSIDLTPHSFRKACATNLYIRTKDLLFVRDYLNHADAKVTQTYIDRKTLSQESRRLH